MMMLNSISHLWRSNESSGCFVPSISMYALSTSWAPNSLLGTREGRQKNTEDSDPCLEEHIASIMLERMWCYDKTETFCGLYSFGGHLREFVYWVQRKIRLKEPYVATVIMDVALEPYSDEYHCLILELSLASSYLLIPGWQGPPSRANYVFCFSGQCSSKCGIYLRFSWAPTQIHWDWISRGRPWESTFVRNLPLMLLTYCKAW